METAVAPRIPDHELLSPIGRGSYGEVWLGRNLATGAYRAIKVVRRSTFEHDKPYQRELAGLRKFEPVSRSHDGLMDVLHVGEDDGEGLFYAVMELADDASEGRRENAECRMTPERYAPRTLRREIQARGRLPTEEVLRIGILLASALGHLHEHGLVHRDIKPSNIIFVDGVPKLADIGLVTDRDTTGSFVGTEGYVPPEGPGTAAADVYALGKVLYEACTGRDRLDYPELPTALKDFPDRGAVAQMNEVLLRACEPVRGDRYQSARELEDDLQCLQKGQSLRRKHRSAKYQRLAKQIGATVAAILGIALGGHSVARLTRGPDEPVLSAIPIAPPLVGHSLAGVVAFDGEVYVISGYSSTNNWTQMTEVYNPRRNTWSRVADFPSGRDCLAAFELKGLIYAVAGEGPTSGEFSQTVFRYNPKSNQWKQLNDFPVKSWGAMAAVCEGKAYVMGGRRGYGATCGDVYEYDPEADAWIPRAPMPVAVRHAGAAVYAGKVYVFAGVFHASEKERHDTNTLQVFDPAANSWITKSMPVRLQAPVAALQTANGVYLLSKNFWSDIEGCWRESTSVRRYSPEAPETKQWKEIELRTPALASPAQLPVCIKDTIYVIDTDPFTKRAWKLRLPAN